LPEDLFNRLGAAPVAISGGEIYTSLDTGVIDAAEFITLKEDFDFGFHEVTDYVLWPSFHSVASMADFAVNMDAWAKLPDDLKIIFEMSLNEIAYFRDLKLRAADYEILQQLDELGMERTILPEEDWATLLPMAVEVAEAYAAKSPLADRVITSYIDYLKFIGRLQ
jgi:TRAP-type mannitol/chloroaromatic compound transport system substrate-binding protein